MFYSLLHEPPSGTKKYITPEEYASLSDEGQYYYQPEWREYRTKKVRDYSECGECGHREFLGWIEEQVPLGEPYRYIYTQPFMPYQVIRSIQAAEIDSINRSNVLMKRVINDKYESEEV
jgi:hypothetical protein